ncbi:MAG: glycoside hydrolase family 97 catalytic domain-containing protein [Rikenellaceae bacterium]
MMRNIITLLTAALFVCCSQPQPESPYTLTSQLNDLRISLEVAQEDLTIELYDGDDVVLSKSPISFFLDNELVSCELTGSEKIDSVAVLPMLYGEFSQVSVPYSDMVCGVRFTNLAEKTIEGTVTVRLFESGFAYRIKLNNVPPKSTIREISELIPADLEGKCFVTNGELEPLGAMSISQARRMCRTPLVYQTEDRLLAFHECDLRDYPQLFLQGRADGSSLAVKIEKISILGDVELPWRTVMLGEKFEDLHNQKPIYQTMNRDSEGDFSWVKPGLSMWDWSAQSAGNYNYDMNTESLKRYIDFCSKSNISYLLVDERWREEHDPLSAIEGLDIQEVVEYGQKMGVGIILYYDTEYVTEQYPAIDFDSVAKTFSELGIAGIKYGFLRSKSNLARTAMSQDIIQTAAKYKLLIDFYDSPIPFSGLERTYPNFINRGFCNAQLDRRTTFTPRQFVRMASLNLLAGDMDQANGIFALNDIASLSKEPQREYNSTISGEVARFIFSHTGLFSVLIDTPEAYEKKADIFEVIKYMPTSWDETIYLDMDYDSYVAVAKRSEDMWYAAVVYNEKGGAHKLNLKFLDPDSKYSATIYRDADDTNYKTNKEKYIIDNMEVNHRSSIKINVPSGGGYSVVFKKI